MGVEGSALRVRPLLVVGMTALVVLVAGILGSPGPQREASEPPLPTVGVQFHGLWRSYTDGDRAMVLDRLVEAGVEWVRIDLSWAMLQPEPGPEYSEWGTDRADLVVDMAADRGLEILATFWLTPGWANGGAGERAAPTDPEDYAAALAWAADHFGDRVAAWEIWNEPNDPRFFAGADPATYASLLRASYRAVKDAEPEATVVFGGTSFNDTEWIEQVYAAGAGDHFDLMATHPYQGISDMEPEAPEDGTMYRLTHVRAVREVMARNGDEDKDIWFTEFGWSSHGVNGPDVPHYKRGVSRQLQADYLARTLHLLADRYPYVTQVFWYRDRDSDRGSPQLDNYGLLDSELRPKPVWERLQQELREER